MKNDGLMPIIIEAIKKDGRKPRRISMEAGLGPNYLQQMINNYVKKGTDPFPKLFIILRALNVIPPYIYSDMSAIAVDNEFRHLFAKLDETQKNNVVGILRAINQDSSATT